jgi:hypothetical protein
LEKGARGIDFVPSFEAIIGNVNLALPPWRMYENFHKKFTFANLILKKSQNDD